MIDHLRQMAIFARVVDKGSFKAAAQDIGLAPSRISENVSELEQYLGVTLLYRTTRKFTLTNEGNIFYARVTEMMRNAEAGLNELNALSEEPVGALRVSIPAFMATGPMSSATAAFARRYPNVALSVTYTDHRMGLLEDGFDLNIRVGWLDDSSMMARKLAEGQRVLVASRDYMKGRQMPQRPSDLEDWDWIRYQQRADTTEFTSPTGEVEKVTGNAQIEVDSIDALYHFVLQNMGVTIVPSYLAKQGEDDGTVVRLLPEWTLEPLGIFVVWPDKSRRESLTLLFARFLADQELC
jgi:DNA-binding transcriptional LysR family regulator